MGLFSIFSKNKQDTAQDSGHFSRDDDEFGRQARARRASHANQANESGQGGSRRSRSGGDPMLPEKKRARRRLVGAVALALAAAVGLPMLLDSEPRPLNGDIAIQIPSKEKAPALPLPASPVPAAESVDQDEEIIAPPPETPATRSAAVPAARTPAARTPIADEPPPLVYDEPEIKPAKPAPKVVEHKPEPKPVEHKPKPEPKPVERKVVEKPAEKPPVKKPEEKPVAPKAKDSEAARALALLEGKPATKPAESHPRAEDKAETKAEAHQRFVVQVAALATQEKVDELQARLRAGGISSFTKKSGALIKVQVGPFGSREEADRTKAKLGSLGLGGFLVPV